MKFDFTIKQYKELLQKLIGKGYRIITFEAYCTEKDELSDESFVVLRHDDHLPHE